MENNNQYIISGGKEGKSRLKILSETLFPYTESLFKKLNVSDCKSFLDMGCGGGNVAMLAAKMMGNDSHVTGVDFDPEIIQLARQDAQEMGLTNISFEALSAYEVQYRNEFDIAYARFLLSHLTRPGEVLNNMIQSVKPGGKVVVEDTHFSGHVCYPECNAFNLYVEYYKKAAFHNGHNPEIGPSLFSLFLEAGLTDVGFDVILPCFNTGTGKWMAFITLDRIKNTLVTQRIATPEKVAAMLQELEAFTDDETTIISMPHIFRVWGTKIG